MLRPLVVSLLASVLVCLLVGCGLKGPLVLPTKSKPPAAAPAPPAEHAEDMDKVGTEQNKNGAAASSSNSTNASSGK
jgi:predicted small lipoprotein YifL